MDPQDSMLYLDAALEVDANHGGRGGTSNSDVHIAFSTIEGTLYFTHLRVVTRVYVNFSV